MRFFFGVANDKEYRSLSAHLLERTTNNTHHIKNTKSVSAAKEEAEVASGMEPPPCQSEAMDSPPGGENKLFEMPSVSWYQQWITIVQYKTIPLLLRRPVFLVAMTVSSIVSVLLSWAAGADHEIYAPTDGTCGGPDPDYEAKLGLDPDDWNYTPVSISDRWQNAFPIFCLSLGPLVFATAVYLIVHDEIQLKLFTILHGLGTKDSVYWMSWFIPFAVIAVANALLGAITAQFVPVHVYRSVYFGGIFAALWFVQLASISASLLAAAITGTSRRVYVVWLIVFLVVTLVPFLITMMASYPPSARSVLEYGTDGSLHGLFWYHASTQSPYYEWDRVATFTMSNDTNSTALQDGQSQVFSSSDYSFDELEEVKCHLPLMSFEEGAMYKNSTEQMEVATSDFFVGCIAQTGLGTLLWDFRGPAKLITVALYLLPSFHLHSIFSNFLGYTSNQKSKFTIRESSLSAAKLAGEVSNVEEPKADLLFGQGTLMEIKSPRWSYDIPCEEFADDDYFSADDEYSSGAFYSCERQELNCATNVGFGICPELRSQCGKARSVDSPSVHGLIGHLLCLTLLYLLLTVYWGVAFVTGTRRLFFPFQRSYWFGVNSNARPFSTAVVINSVKKTFGSVEAVKGVSLRMAVGEITAMLGHNGAGKTTLSNMITCETLPTQGEITIMGMSVMDDPYSVRRIAGVCKQDDYLWPSLSAKEHLFLFAGLRGVPTDQQGTTVQEWLESVDLDIAQNQFSRQFSGGMKRRLSLALATIGSSPLIVLDEPSTGMDPVSRRLVWRHIDSIKKDRVVLLTTHSMEEADLLSDQVAIMKEGELAAVGTSLELKSQYGSALQFTLLTEPSTSSSARESIETMFSEASKYVTVESSGAGNIRVNVVKVNQDDDESQDGVQVRDLCAFVSWLESKDSPITEYGFSNSSLEEVFLKITNTDPVAVEASHPPENTTGGIGSADDHTTDPGPIQSGDQEYARVTGALKGISAFQPSLSVSNQLDALFYHHVTKAWTGRRSMGVWLTIFISMIVVVVVGTGTANLEGSEHLSATAPILAISLIILGISSSMYGDRYDGLFYLMKSQGLLSESYSLSYVLYSLEVGLIYSLCMVTIYYATPIFRQPEPCDFNDCPWPKFGQNPVVFDATTINLEIGELLKDSSAFPEADDVLNVSPAFSLTAYRSPRGYGQVFIAALLFGASFPGITLASSYFPGHKLGLFVIAILLLASSVAPLFLTTLFDVYSDEFREDCFARVAPSINCFDFTIDNITDDFLNCAGLLVNGQEALGSLCHPAVWGLLPQFALFQELAAALLGRITFVSSPPSFVEDTLVPRLKAIGQHCDGSTCDFPHASKLYWQIAGYQVLGTIVLLLVGSFIMTVFLFPPESVLRLKKKLASAFDSARNGQDLSQKASDQHELEEVSRERDIVAKTMENYVDTAPSGSVGLNSREIPRDSMPPVVMHRLRKEYPAVGKIPKKVALKSLDLHVPKGQVLGLLGKNGAGKTTALKILSCAHDSSNGVGLVAGYDVELERTSVFSRLGSCAQFDTIWPRLSVKEHLEFFSRLKGVPKPVANRAAHDIAAAVGLGSSDVYNRHAGALSGGMRRRLSIAISLVSAPKALLLDEPTTGLDPATRKSIWDLITMLSAEDRGIILTTHQMIEADTLCDRIAIMAKGELVVVATQQYLKDRFGNGYILQLNLVQKTPETETMAMEFCRNHLHNGAVLTLTQAKTLHVKLPTDLDLARVFSALYDPRVRPNCINQFLLNQSSLEDVFISLGDGLAVDEQP